MASVQDSAAPAAQEQSGETGAVNSKDVVPQTTSENEQCKS